jgi:hypothetical protein
MVVGTGCGVWVKTNVDVLVGVSDLFMLETSRALAQLAVQIPTRRRVRISIIYGLNPLGCIMAGVRIGLVSYYLPWFILNFDMFELR